MRWAASFAFQIDGVSEREFEDQSNARFSNVLLDTDDGSCQNECRVRHEPAGGNAVYVVAFDHRGHYVGLHVKCHDG